MYLLLYILFFVILFLKGDQNAHAEFVRINRAYEILRDDELRKKYDTYGEEGLKDDFNRGNQYQSWNFYQQNFGMYVYSILFYNKFLFFIGIYDEDPEIITLSRTDFCKVTFFDCLNSNIVYTHFSTINRWYTRYMVY